MDGGWWMVGIAACLELLRVKGGVWEGRGGRGYFYEWISLGRGGLGLGGRWKMLDRERGKGKGKGGDGARNKDSNPSILVLIWEKVREIHESNMRVAVGYGLGWICSYLDFDILESVRSSKVWCCDFCGIFCVVVQGCGILGAGFWVLRCWLLDVRC